MFEVMLGSGGEQSSGIPGPEEYICDGESGVCFYGEVASSDLITGDALASLVNFNSGTSINSTEPWLKVRDNGKILFIAKRPLRYNISPSLFNAANIESGNKAVTIKGNRYKIRTLNYDAPKPTSGYVTQAAHQYNTEWNRIMYRLVAHAGSSNEGIPFGTLARYSGNDLRNAGDIMLGIRSIVSYVGGNTASYRWSEFHYSCNAMSNVYNERGWRPVLELAE